MTIAQQLKIKKFPFEIKDSKGNTIYYEKSDGFWYKAEYNSNNKQIYHENSVGFWDKREYNSNNKQIYYENSFGFWYSTEFDSNGKEIYYKNSEGHIRDNRPKTITELTMNEIAKKFNVPVETLNIKK